MGNFADYQRMREEADNAKTVIDIHNLLTRYKLIPRGMIEELQNKLDIINENNKNNGTRMIHLIRRKE